MKILLKEVTDFNSEKDKHIEKHFKTCDDIYADLEGTIYLDSNEIKVGNGIDLTIQTGNSFTDYKRFKEMNETAYLHLVNLVTLALKNNKNIMVKYTKIIDKSIFTDKEVSLGSVDIELI